MSRNRGVSGDNEVLIPNGIDFIKAGGFFLELPLSVTVVYETWGGQIHTKTLPEGFIPIKMRKVFAANASVVYAIW